MFSYIINENLLSTDSSTYRNSLRIKDCLKIYLISLFAKTSADSAEVMAFAKAATQKTKANPEKFKELLADTSKEAFLDNGVAFQVGQKEDGSMHYFVLEETYFKKQNNE